MPPVFDAGKPLVAGPGWGCSCPSFRYGEPDPATALSRLAGSVSVTVKYLDENSDGLNFEAWTNPEKHYAVTFGEGNRVGWCKHILSCMSHYLPWHRQLALGASDALAKIHRLGKENRRLERTNKRLEAKLGK